MLLAELPVRGEPLVNTGMRIIQRVQSKPGRRGAPPNQWQGNGRASDVL